MAAESKFLRVNFTVFLSAARPCPRFFPCQRAFGGIAKISLGANGNMAVSENKTSLLSLGKDEARRLFRERRRALDPDYRHSASGRIVERLACWEPLRRAECVMTYLSFGEEVETFRLARLLLAEGKSLAIPYIHEGTTNLIAALIADLEHDLHKGPLDILEPRPERLRPIDPKKIAVHIVPGVAFDLRGFRIGYGKGYYDRFLLLRSSESLTVGLAFDIQVAERLPYDHWDIPVDFVATETRLIDCSVARRAITGQLGLFQQAKTAR